MTARLSLFSPDQPDRQRAESQTALTIRDVLTLYLRHSRAQSVHGKIGLADREYTFGLFVAAYGDVEVSQAKPFMLSDFIEGHAAWKSTSTKRVRFNHVRAAFSWALEGERIERNPFRKCPYPEAERRPDMPDQVIEQLQRVANKPLERVVRFLRLTGCRLGELCAAVWGDMDLDRGAWCIPHHKTRKHTGKAKVVALVPEAVELLRSLLAVAAAHAVRPNAEVAAASQACIADPAAFVGKVFVFLNTAGRPWKANTLSVQLWRLKRRGVIATDATLHGIRHRAASAAVAAGAPIKLVSLQLGHASVRTTEAFYCHLDGEIDAIREAMQKGTPKK